MQKTQKRLIFRLKSSFFRKHVNLVKQKKNYKILRMSELKKKHTDFKIF